MPQPRNPAIHIGFSDYPDPITLNFPTLRFGPRGQNIQFLLDVSLVAKQISLRPRTHLLEGIDYFVTLDADTRAISGQPLADSPYVLTFHTGAQLLPDPAAEEIVTLDRLLKTDGPLRRSCGRSGCHSSTDGAPPVRGLDFLADEARVRQQLVGKRRAGREGDRRLFLVEPGSPETSYLLRKLLARSEGGFLDIEGEPMPPPASGLPPLDTAVLTAIETWIRQGAN